MSDVSKFDEFEFPEYAGLETLFTESSEACDAMQKIWSKFTAGEYKNKAQFKKAYRSELKELGEKIR